MKKGLAIIGCGYWGINYVRLLSQTKEISLVAVCDQSKERLQSVQKQFPGPKLFSEVDQVVESNEIDAVVVCTNPSSHFEITKKLIESGKHVLVEKPITTNSTDARKLIELAKKHQVILMVGHIFLYNAGVDKAKSYIDSGEIGKIYYLYTRRTNLGPIRPDVNVFWDLAPHDISILNFFLDSQPEVVNAVGTNFLQSSEEDTGFITLHYPGGIIGNIHVSWADPHKVRRVIIVGSDLRISFDDISAKSPLTVYQKGVAASITEEPDYGEFKLLIRDGDIIIPKFQSNEPLKNQMQHFLECIDTGRKPRSDGVEGLKVIQVMEAVNKSIENMGIPVKVPEISEDI